MMIARRSKVVMCLCLAAFAFICAFDNIFDYGANFEFVRHVLSMDTTFHDPAIMRRAVTAPVLWHAGYWLIIAGEALTGLLFALGAWAMWQARHASARAFQRAKHWSIAGALVGFLVWYFGFMVVGGEWFAMWQSRSWNGQEGAFRFYLTILAVLIFVNQRDEDELG
jgi:predicted small integral membrane protein